MLIISKFHDFYDSAMIYGQDKDCVYNRITSVIPTKNDINLPYHVEFNLADDVLLTVTPIVIGFCGKFYPVLEFSYSKKTSSILKYQLPQNDYIYDAEDYINILEKQGKSFRKNNYFSWGRGSLDDKKGINNFFNMDYSYLAPLFREHHAPVIKVKMKSCEINPTLKNLSFFRVVDPSTAFQEIYMYIGGVLGNKEKGIITISDKDKAKQHGHDGKYSFKTPKVKK